MATMVKIDMEKLNTKIFLTVPSKIINSVKIVKKSYDLYSKVETDLLQDKEYKTLFIDGLIYCA